VRVNNRNANNTSHVNTGQDTALTKLACYWHQGTSKKANYPNKWRESKLKHYRLGLISFIFVDNDNCCILLLIRGSTELRCVRQMVSNRAHLHVSFANKAIIRLPWSCKSARL